MHKPIPVSLGGTEAEGAAGGIMAHNVTVTYRNGHTALYDASFEIPRGTITALVGVNGAGKSTSIRILYGFYQSDGCTIPVAVTLRDFK